MKRLENPNWNKRRQSRKWLWLIVAGIFLTTTIGVCSAFVAKKYDIGSSQLVNVSNNEPKKTIFVTRESQLQLAIDTAKPGETIVLKAGETFNAAIKLPKKMGSEFITIRTSADDSELPAENVRLDPKKYASKLAKIVSNVKGEPAVFASIGAHHFRFVGIEFGPTIEGLYNIIQLGTGDEKTVEELPHHIEFDRVYIHGDKTVGQRRGIAANGRNIVIKNSYISDIKRKGEESQTIAVWSTDGPVEIVNNYLEAAAENVLFGGAGSNLKLVPTDCIVRDNWLNKPIEWKDTDWVVKNLFEIKNGKRIKVSNNLMTNNWAMGQDGTAVLFTVREDNGKATVIEDIEFADNIIRGSSSALSIYGDEGSGGSRLTIRNNIFADINSKKWGGNGNFMKCTTWNGLLIENNTAIHDGNITTAYGKPIDKFVFRNNIVFNNEYGFMGDSMSPGKSTLGKFFPNSVVTNSVIVGGTSTNYGDSNFYPNSLNQIGFAKPESGDYRLRPDSSFLRKGLGGKQIGANLDSALVGGTRF
jgi:hypothetical protein